MMKVSWSCNLDSLWLRDLTRICGEGTKHPWFEGNVTWKVGNRKRILF